MFPWLAFTTEVFMETVPFVFCCRRIFDYSIKTGNRSFLREYNILFISTGGNEAMKKSIVAILISIFVSQIASASWTPAR